MPSPFPGLVSMPHPRRMITPRSPSATPARRRICNASSPAPAMTITVNNGVVAFRIEASPLGMKVWPITISENGMTLLSSPIAQNGFQPIMPLGRPILCARSNGSRIAAPSATRKNTSVSGGNSRRAAPLKKNEPPQRTESTASSDQSRASIRLSLAGMASHIGDPTCRLVRRSGRCHPISEMAPKGPRSGSRHHYAPRRRYRQQPPR
ncbi:hypothetical protein AB7M17_005903 [Bradyrhizobium sp. USDA 377]